ncbi:hypothetical protein ACFL0D_06935 [Thermoproteota archaeon]
MSFTFEIGSTLDQCLRFALIVYLCVKIYLGSVSLYLAEKYRGQEDIEDGIEDAVV